MGLHFLILSSASESFTFSYLSTYYFVISIGDMQIFLKYLSLCNSEKETGVPFYWVFVFLLKEAIVWKSIQALYDYIEDTMQ